MKTLLTLAFTIPAFLLLSCSSTTMVEKRITKYPELFSQLSEDHQLLVREGRITEGMNKNAVFLAWGPADAINQGSKNGKRVETWIYENRYGGYGGYGRPCFNVGFGYGSYGGGGSVGYGVGFPVFPEPYYHDVPSAVVVFTGNQVTEWQSSAR